MSARDSVGHLVEYVRASGAGLMLTPDDQIKLETSVHAPVSVSHRDALKRNRDTVVDLLKLERRLATGYAKCERVTGRELERLDDFWVDLLHTYERTFDTLVDDAREGIPA